MAEIAILETGVPPENYADQFGRYTDMFMTLAGPEHAYAVFDAQACVFPDDPAAWDAVMVTGSPAGTYDPLPWIDPLKDFLNAAKGKTRLVGICFGHQIMAEAFGGRVEKSDKGWGIGLHTYVVERREPWMGSAPPPCVSIPVSHQDQVVEKPPSAEVVAASRFTPFAALSYTDHPAISFQFHPEFEPEYAERLIERRIKRHDVTEEHAELALASLRQPDDRPLVAEWVRRFIDT
jgi:GMP synthase-like glutamine amidotransferase